MGNKLATKDPILKSKTQFIHDLLVYGYIRENTTNNLCVIPEVIQSMCIDFYYQHWYLFMTTGSTPMPTPTHFTRFVNSRMDFNSIKCLNIKNYQTFNLKLQNLDVTDGSNTIQNDPNWDKMFYGQSYSQNTLLPQWVINKYNNNNNAQLIDSRHRYHILYRIGGAKASNLKLGTQCNCVIFNSQHFKQNNGKDINGFYCNLPDISQPMTSVTSLLHKKNNTLYVIGRTEFGKNYIYSLDLNCNELAWDRSSGILTRKTCGVALSQIDNNDILMLMCGGRGYGHLPHNECNVVNMTQKTMINVSSMNQSRAYFNCIPYRRNNENEFIVGGGYKKCKTLETYDIICDKWTLLQQETNYVHEGSSVLWMDNCDHNIVYIAGENLGYEQLRGLGYVEWCDLRENTNKFNVLCNKSIARLFKIKGKDITDKWEVRSLLI